MDFNRAFAVYNAMSLVFSIQIPLCTIKYSFNWLARPKVKLNWLLLYTCLVSKWGGLKGICREVSFLYLCHWVCVTRKMSVERLYGRWVKNECVIIGRNKSTRIWFNDWSNVLTVCYFSWIIIVSIWLEPDHNVASVSCLLIDNILFQWDNDPLGGCLLYTSPSPRD